jgi:putative membrane protein
MALQQGPLARRFRVADLVLHTTAGPVSPRLIQAGLDEARALFDAQAARARDARKRQTSEQWLAQVAPAVTGPAMAPDPANFDHRSGPDYRETPGRPQNHQEGPQHG